MSNEGITYNPYDQNVIITGNAGSGKTYFSNWLILKCLIPADVSFVIYDYNWRGYKDKLVWIPSSHQFQTHHQYIYQPRDKKLASFVQFCRFHNKPNKILIVEEVQEYAGQNFMPEAFETIIRTGRNFGNCYVAITQRPQEIHKAIVSNADHIFVFKFSWFNDVKTVAQWINGTPEAITSLQKWQFLYKYKYADAPVLMNPVSMQAK